MGNTGKKEGDGRALQLITARLFAGLSPQSRALFEKEFSPEIVMRLKADAKLIGEKGFEKLLADLRGPETDVLKAVVNAPSPAAGGDSGIFKFSRSARSTVGNWCTSIRRAR